MKAYTGITSDNQSNFGYLIKEGELWSFVVKKHLDSLKRFRPRTICNYSLGEIIDESISSIEEIVQQQQQRTFITNYWVEHENQPGEYSLNIYRPLLDLSYNHNYYGNENIYAVEQLIHDERTTQIEGSFWAENFDTESAIISFNQATILVRNLSHLFEFIFPVGQNLSSYSNSTRNLLILVCTEFENQIKRILENNGISKMSAYYNTKDYVRIKEKLHLSEYKISLNNYPLQIDICPFANWDNSNPTTSLTWYNAYNQVKHDRENSFHLGTLQSCIDSICGLLIILASKYGHVGTLWNRELSDFFRFSQLPMFNQREFYIPPLEGCDWIMKPLTL